jgi:HSP20 family protein
MRELIAVQEKMNRLFESALTRTNFDPSGGAGSWTPVADAWETDGEIRFALEIPGLAMDRMDVRVEGKHLVVEGERPMERERPGEHYHRVEGSYGSFSRRFELPAAAERDGAKATYRNGVLTVRLPKRPTAPPGPIRLQVR